MPPPPMLLPRRHLVGGLTAAAKPVSLISFSLLSVGLGCRRSYSSASPSSSRTAGSRRFSSNAEQSTGSRRRWWSDEAQFDGADDDEEFEKEGFSFRGSASWTDQAFEEPWFTKVWRGYGYVLPVILVSILAATGPRAFLMAMAIPLAQSALSFAVRAFSNTFGSSRRRDDREEYDDDYYYSDYRSSGWESEDAAEDSFSYSTNSRYQQQQPWGADAKPEDSVPTAGSDDTVSSASNNNKTSKSGNSRSAGFGGWDELDAGDQQYVRSSSRRRSAGASPPTPDTAAKTASAGGAAGSVGRRRPEPETAARGRRRPRRSRAAARYRGQSPLFMRLLVALFPFLGSWFRIML